MTDLLQPLGAVVLVLGLLGATLYFLRRHGVASFSGGGGFRPQSKEKHMKVLERMALGPQHALHLVRVGDRTLLISTAPGSCRLIDSAGPPIDRVTQ
jgi:flagellar biosynthetic protein FliO